MWNLLLKALCWIAVEVGVSLSAQAGEQGLMAFARWLVGKLLCDCAGDVKEQILADFDARPNTFEKLRFAVALISPRVALSSRWRRKDKAIDTTTTSQSIVNVEHYFPKWT